ncbi:uncharacterized protein LOC125916467 isoform X2 [Panthera uncia]|uniref:uncharacterized protein LOC125916467 isoform X2 n=1 Tax=Panthera uncia TaxID=29064 RepID=UPI0020FFE559|nr:uncharacterized protein LOC125916467 isoform X2 [Panthera uncia]
MGGFYEQPGFHLHSVTWPHLTARDAGRGGRRKRKGGGGQPADRPRTRRPRDCLRDTVRHPRADEHANLTAAPPAPRCRELRSLGSPLLPSLSEPRLQRLRRRASRPPTPHPRGAGGGGLSVSLEPTDPGRNCRTGERCQKCTQRPRAAGSRLRAAAQGPQRRRPLEKDLHEARERSARGSAPHRCRPGPPLRRNRVLCAAAFVQRSLPWAGRPGARGPGHQGDVKRQKLVLPEFCELLLDDQRKARV